MPQSERLAPGSAGLRRAAQSCAEAPRTDISADILAQLIALSCCPGCGYAGSDAMIVSQKRRA